MEQEILKILHKKKNTSLTSIEINDFLGLNSTNEYEELEKILDKLCQEGKIYYSEKKKRYTIALKRAVANYFIRELEPGERVICKDNNGNNLYYKNLEIVSRCKYERNKI